MDMIDSESEHSDVELSCEDLPEGLTGYMFW